MLIAKLCKLLFAVLITGVLSTIVIIQMKTVVLANLLDTPRATEYPVLADTFIAFGQKATAFPVNLAQVFVGYNDSRLEERALLKFQPPNIPQSSTIHSAVLMLYLSGATPVSDTISDFSVFRVIGDWQESISWEQYENLLTTDISISSTKSVGLALDWVDWDVKKLIAKWVNDPQHTDYLSLELRGNDTQSPHERKFLTRDCTLNSCLIPQNKQPKLIIDYSTPTSVAIPSSTPIPTPTPGIAALILHVDPTNEIRVNQEITYSIEFQNGSSPLSKVQITNSIPSQLEFVPGSFQSEGGLTINPGISDQTVFWTFVHPLPAGASGSVSYRARRLEPTATPLQPPTAPSTNTPTPTIANTLAPTPTTTPTATQTSTPSPTTAATKTSITIEVVAVPKDSQNFEFDGSLGTFTLDDADPDDEDNVAKSQSFDLNSTNQPVVITQKALDQWALVNVVCHPSSNIERNNAARTLTITSNTAVNQYCVFINVRNDQLELASTQILIDQFSKEVSQSPDAHLVETPIPTAVPTAALLEPIVNQGAMMQWSYQQGSVFVPGAIKSNMVFNPSFQLYLPIVARQINSQ